MASPGTPSSQLPPSRRNCGAVQSYFGTLDKFPKFRDNQGALEARTRDFVNRGEAALRTTLTTIPVAVHVVYNTDEENLSDEQIRSQIDVLNDDYQINNADIDKVLSHINSYSRPALNNKAPFDLFAFTYGVDLLTQLGLERIPADRIVLKPSLLG